MNLGQRDKPPTQLVMFRRTAAVWLDCREVGLRPTPAASATLAAGAAQSLAQKQREVLEGSLREAQALARDFQPSGSAQENLAKQAEFARKVFDISLQGAREAAETSRQSAAEQVKIIQERMKASLEEFRASVSGAAAAGSDKSKS
jgi:phasin family protein